MNNRNLKSRRYRQILALLLISALSVGAAYEGGLFLAGRRMTVAGGGGVDCTSKSSDEIITYFYKPGTSSARLQALQRQTGGVTVSSYPALSGVSLEVPLNSYQSDLSVIKHAGFVTSASASANQGCQDPD